MGKEVKNRPFIVCHMMSSVDGRIDCGMTEHLKGVDEYYSALERLNVLTTVSGRVTAELEMALPGKFDPKKASYGREGFSKKPSSKGYDVVVDTKGSLLWKDDSSYGRPHLILTSERASVDYLEYLDSKGISWIACGKDKVDLVRATEIMAKEFGVERMAIVGGPMINGAFLQAGLLDEISLLIGPGIDGRSGMQGVFEGIPEDAGVIPLSLKGVTAFDDGAVWIRYSVND